MGLPETRIEFKELARSIAVRSARGTVALILNDTKEEGETRTIYARFSDVNADEWSADSLKWIKIAFNSGANKVLAVKKNKFGESSTAISGVLSSLKKLQYNWLCAPELTAEEKTLIINFIKEQRKLGYTPKAVLADCSDADCEGIVNFTTKDIESNISGASQVYSAQEYTVRLAGMFSGISLHRSATGLVLMDVVSAKPSATPNEDIDSGKLILEYNGEGYEIARAITSLVSQTGVPRLFKKIKHVEGADLIAQDMALIFEKNYRGKRVNDYNTKQSLVAEYIAYFSELTGSVLSADFANTAAIDVEAQREYLKQKGINTDVMDDFEIASAGTDEQVFISANIRLVDAMEDMFISVILD